MSVLMGEHLQTLAEYPPVQAGASFDMSNAVESFLGKPLQSPVKRRSSKNPASAGKLTGGKMMRDRLVTSAAALSVGLALATGALAQVQLDHGTAETLTALGIDTAQVTEEDDVGYINQILASDADDATKKAEIEKLIDEY
jgi:hypothetical protein